MGLFDSTDEHPPDRIRRYIITGVAAVVLAFLFLWYWPGNLRFYAERRTVDHFMTAVVAGNLQEAYRIWKPSPSYEFKDFLEDWGPGGYYGPIKSYRIESTQSVRNAPSAAIVVAVSPYSPFPKDSDEAEQSKTQKVTLWVEPKDESISFPPY
ncbi:MAG TPA: hypothetical protein VJR26_13810 [Candidatus Acidoferrales bacterium]|nr:hypothetical protein [Candidatus Acidoferrales bacterium]